MTQREIAQTEDALSVLLGRTPEDVSRSGDSSRHSMLDRRCQWAFHQRFSSAVPISGRQNRRSWLKGRPPAIHLTSSIRNGRSNSWA